MDELPNCYTQNDDNYKWFYSFNPGTMQWDMDHLFDHTLQYYSIWVEDLADALNETFEMNDGYPPLSPGNLTVVSQTRTTATLSWTKGDDFDFDTYEIMYSLQPFNEENYSIWSRSNDSNLASPYCEQTTVTGLLNNRDYEFRIRARDKNGNYSGQDYQAPVVANVTALQRLDGSKIIDIYYDLSDADTESCYVSMLLSDNNGSSFDLTPDDANISGDANSLVATGINKHIVWNAGAESFLLDGSTYKFRIIAEDE
jgi:hypothetical protein